MTLSWKIIWKTRKRPTILQCESQLECLLILQRKHRWRCYTYKDAMNVGYIDWGLIFGPFELWYTREVPTFG